MKRIISLALVILFLFSSIAFAKDVYVNSYTRKDGTYVQGYHRSSPDSTVTNNYDFKGNNNPYTGQTGDNYYRDKPSSPYYGSSSNSNSLFGSGSSGQGSRSLKLLDD